MRASSAFRAAVAPGGVLAGPWVRNELWRRARAVPSLDLRFAENKSLGDAVTGQSLVTFTRASSGTYVGSDGLIKTATTNEARFDHDPTTGESLGLLVEESRTNLLEYSEEFDQAAWSVSNASVSANQTIAPDGNTTADKLVCGTGTPVFQGIVQSITATASATRFSVYFKAAGIDQVELRSFNPADLAIFELSTQQVLSQSGSPDPTITDAGNGWYRCSITSSSSAATSFRISLASGGSRTFTPILGAGLYIWGAQLEEGSFPTSYIPTEGSTVTRSADVASISGSNFSSWYRQDEGTIFNNSTVIVPNVQTQAAWSLTGGTYNTSLRQPQSTGDRFRARIGNTFTPSPGTGDLLSSGTRKACVAYSGTAGRLQVGSSSDDATAVGVLDPTEFNVGSLGGTSAILNGTIRRLTYWPARLPNETLQTITQ